MNLNFKKSIAVVLLASTVLLSYTSVAGPLESALDGMFMSNVTNPGAYSSQTRGGFVGGSASLRSPVRNINLFNFDPPRLNAGCGGIDMYGGSFSFINSEQLNALFRSIAANAVGAAFQLAIRSISPQLATIMNDFQKKLQDLNSMFKNTCAVANQLVKTLSDPTALKGAVDEAGTMLETAAGSVTDLFGALGSLFTTPTASTDSDTADDNPYVGNFTWKALMKTQSGQMIGNPSTTGTLFGNQGNYYVMSLIGTTVMPKSSGDCTDPDDQACAPTPATYLAKLTLPDLRDGVKEGEQKTYYSCSDPDDGCLNITQPAFTFKGTLGYVNKMLFDDADGLTGTVSSNSIIARISSGQSLTSEQRAFINTISLPALKILRDVQAAPGALEVMATRMAPIMADELAMYMGQAALAASTAAYSGVNDVPIPPHVLDAIGKLRDEMGKMREATSEHTDRIIALQQYARIVVESNPALLASIRR